ncbi:MAG: HepT-like ribonuclease domain-containing protein [Candidatus Marinimicrobia bacterium]|nr:HepT-like ribonuclease domain-containing protein [Candidatus Neomarinimicrobiota bacterium]
MYDKTLVQDILNQILSATRTVQDRFEPIKSIDDFTNTPAGMEKLDAICMLVIAVGESLKNLDKITEKTILVKYSRIDWKGAMGMRDIITHHYFDIDAEQIFWVCEHQMKPLAETIEQILQEMG